MDDKVAKSTSNRRFFYMDGSTTSNRRFFHMVGSTCILLLVLCNLYASVLGSRNGKRMSLCVAPRFSKFEWEVTDGYGRKYIVLKMTLRRYGFYLLHANVAIHVLYADSSLHFSNDKDTYAKSSVQLRKKLDFKPGDIEVHLGNKIVLNQSNSKSRYEWRNTYNRISISLTRVQVMLLRLLWPSVFFPRRKDKINFQAKKTMHHIVRLQVFCYFASFTRPDICLVADAE